MKSILLKNIGESYFLPGIESGMSISIIDGVIRHKVEPDCFYDKVIDCSSLSVSPGWVDMHTHVYDGVCSIAMDSDCFGPETGVTTLVDAGSAGYVTYPGFRKYVIDSHDWGIYEFLNYGAIGITKCNKICDYETDEFIDEERTAETVENDRAHIKGIKVRACRVVLKNRGIEIVEAAAALAHRLGLPLMVHIGAPGPTYESIASVLSEGDIITHAFHGKPGNLLESGKVPDWAWDAKSRGVLFDVGHGAASFDINVGRRAIDEGFLPDLIGTDLHKDSYRIAGKLEDVMTKILACSVPLSAVIESVTGRARRVLGIEDYNTGCDGKIADLTLFRLDNTPRTFVDSVGNKINTENGIVAMYSIANGKLYICKERENGNI